MKLKDKTYKKFADFFCEVSKKNHGQEFEIAYSEIQRETGVASITMKKAIQVLAEDGVVHTEPGRNSRYIRVLYLLTQDMGESGEEPKQEEGSGNLDTSQLEELFRVTDQLRQRLRAQEMALASIQERLADLEDKRY